MYYLWHQLESTIVYYHELLHQELEYSRVAVPFIVPTRPNELSILNGQSIPSSEN